MLSQETYNINYNNNFNNSNNSLHTTLQEMTINEKTLVMGNKGISLPTQMMITNSESSFFRRQQHCLNAKKSSTSEYSAMTVWRTFIVSMSIIFAAAILMYLLVIVLFSSETRKSPKSHFHHDYRDRSEFQVATSSTFYKQFTLFESVLPLQFLHSFSLLNLTL